MSKLADARLSLNHIGSNVDVAAQHILSSVRAMIRNGNTLHQAAQVNLRAALADLRMITGNVTYENEFDSIVHKVTA